MPRITAAEASKRLEKKVYFSTQHSFKGVTGFKKGDKKYVMLLKPDEFMFSTRIHSVKAKSKEVGFQGKFGTNIKCKSVEGEEKALCCQLADSEKEKYPEKEESGKRMISYGKYIYHIPVVVLGHNLTDPNTKTYPVSNASISKGYEFAYLEVHGSTYSTEILAKLGEQLKKDEVIDFDLEDDELTEAINANLGNVIVEISAGEPKQGSFAKYQTNYSFIPFTDSKIARKSGDYEKITQWKDLPEMENFRNDVDDFLKLLEDHEPELTVDWTEERLRNYVVDSVERDENIDEYKKSVEEEKPVEVEKELKRPKKVEAPAEEEVPIVEIPIEQIDAIDLGMGEEFEEEDFSYDDYSE